jgi:nucleoside-diphosphate kinase
LKEKTFVLIKPDAYLQTGKIINDLCSLGFQITRVQMLRLNEQSVSVLYREHVGKPYYKQLYMHMTSDVVIGIEVAGDNALNAIKALAGPTNPQIAKQQSP